MNLVSNWRRTTQIFGLTLIALFSFASVQAGNGGNSHSESGWRLKFQEEFDGESLNSDFWSHEVNCAGGGNNELQCYTDRPENSYVSDGVLHIVAKEENFSGPALNDDDPNYDPTDQSKSQPYTSARLRTKDKFDFRYGRVEVRAKVAGGQGMWPAIWMLPTDYRYGIWPQSGEIDIMEAVNLGVWPNQVHGTLHYGLKWPQWENHGATFDMDVNPADDFHVYAIEWEADEIRWYIDGQHYQTQTADSWYSYIWKGQRKGFKAANDYAPFNRKFHLIMNLAAGGDWPGAPDTNWGEDREMQVDYVRVYKCTARERDEKGRRTGKGCGTIDPSVVVNSGAPAPGVNDYLFYSDGIETLELEGGSNTPTAGYWELNEGSLFQSTVELSGKRGTVWDITFNGLSNVFLSAQDMSEVPGLATGLVFEGGSGWTNYGELEFKMRVNEASEDSQFTIKLDSGWPNFGEVVIETPEIGKWRNVKVRLEDLIANPNPNGGGVDIANIQNLFVLEYSGTSANVQIDEIRWQCAFNTEPEDWQIDKTCSLESKTEPIVVDGEVLDIYIDAITQWGVNSCCGGATINEVDLGGNNVMEFVYDNDPGTNTVTFFQSAESLDLSAYAGGTLEFDMFVISQPTNPAANPWIMKTDCEHPCGTGDVPLTDSVEGVLPPTGAWQHYTFNVNDLVARGLDLTTVDTPLVIFPAWGSQDGASFQIDNVQFKQGDAGPPAGPFDVSLSVNVSDAGLAATDVIYVSGSFNDWCGGCNPLTDNGGGVWSTTLTLPVGTYDYKFQVNQWAAQETVPEAPGCGVNKFGFVNREMVVEDSAITLPETPYNGCPE